MKSIFICQAFNPKYRMCLMTCFIYLNSEIRSLYKNKKSDILETWYFKNGRIK